MNKKVGPLVLAAVLATGEAPAADVWTNVHGPLVNIVVEGPIQKGDTARVSAALRAVGPGVHATVVLRSPGGDYEEGISLGRFMRKLKLMVNVPYWTTNGPACEDADGYPPPKDSANCICASACAVAFFGGARRNGSVIGLHRPYFEQTAFSKLSADEAAARYRNLTVASAAYLKEMGVPDGVQKRMLASASNDIDFLEPAYVKKYLWGWIPEIDEWILAKCPGARPRLRALELAERIAAGTASAAENAEFDEINAKDERASSCVVEAEKELRRTAFENYFRAHPKATKN